MGTSLKTDYSGLNNLNKKVKAIENKEVRTGFFDSYYTGEPTELHPNGYNVGVPIAVIARINAEGSFSNPPRDFMQATIDANATKINVRKSLVGYFNKQSLSKTLEQLGKEQAALMKEIIDSWRIHDSNSPQWVREKGFDKPLVYTQQMLDAVDFKIKNKNS